MDTRTPKSGNNRSPRTLFLAGIGLVLFVFAFFGTLVLRAYQRLSDEEVRARFSARSAFTPSNITRPVQPGLFSMLTTDDPALGPDGAKVTIVEFGDFECPFCRQAFSTVKTLLARYGDRVRFQYRDFPVDAIHEHARTAALAANCAGRQGKFWQYHDLLYINQERLQSADLEQYARQAGVETASWRTCMTKPDVAEEVQQDISDGIAAGVEGTPTWFINGHRIEGALPEDDFLTLVEYGLKGKL